MITIQWVLALAGLIFAGYSVLSALDRTNRHRWGNSVFWGLIALSLLAGGRLGDFANGILVLALAGLATLKLTGRGPARASEPELQARSDLHGNRLFVPIAIVLVTAVLGSLIYLYTPLRTSGLLEANRETFILFALGVLLAIAFSLVWLRPPILAPLQEGRRLMDAVGWAVVLPMMLASLGLVLAETGVGRTIGELLLAVIPQGRILPAVIAYALGMALLTILTGNAFAAFPVMATAVAIPILITLYGGDAAVIGAIGMLAGFCGTLLTPMAANFNIVPVALLELKDPHAVIRAQVGTALPLLLVNTALIYWLGWR